MSIKDQIKALEASQAAQLSKLDELGKKAANAGKLGAALLGTGVEVVGDVFEVQDKYKGAGLGFCRAARAKALALQQGWSIERAAEHIGLDIKSDNRRTKSILRTLGVIDDGHFDQVIRGTIQHAESPDAALRTKALSESTFGGGGVFVPDELSMEFLNILLPQLAFVKAGVEKIPMARETLSFARMSVGTSPGWVGENAAAAFTEPNFDSPQLQLKKLAAISVLSNDLLRDASMAPDVILRDNLIAEALLVLDLAFIRSIGSAYSPKGVRYVIPSTQVVNSVVGSGSPTYQTALKDINNLKKTLANANVPETKRAFLLNPRTELGFNLLTDGVGGTPLGNEMSQKKTIRGVPYFTTTQIPTNLTGGGSSTSSESEMTLIEATEWVIGEGMQPTIDIERNGTYVDGAGTVQSGLSKDQTPVRLILRADLMAKHPVSGAVGNGYTYGL